MSLNVASRVGPKTTTPGNARALGLMEPYNGDDFQYKTKYTSTNNSYLYCYASRTIYETTNGVARDDETHQRNQDVLRMM